MPDSVEKMENIIFTINLMRNLSIFLDVFCIVQLILAVLLPDILSSLLKVWLVVITGGTYVGIILGLVIARTDPKTTLFFVVLSSFLSGIVFGVSLVIIVKK